MVKRRLVEPASEVMLDKLVTDFCEWGKIKCLVCGGKLVEIRGRYPKDPKRMVCPDCLQCKLDNIREIADKDYGKPSACAGY